MKLTDKKLSSTHRVLVYGEPKSGKTELAARLSERYNILLFDLENGYETLLKLPTEWQERVEIVSIPDTKVFPIAIETMLKVVTGNKVDICDAHGKVNCAICRKEGAGFSTVELNALSEDWIVLVDSLTQLSNSAMNHLTKGQEDTYKPEWTDYRNQGQLLDKFLSQIQQAKYNIVCITHVVETELEDGKKKLVPVCGTTAFSRNTAKYFDHVVYCQVSNKKHNFASSTTYANNVLTGSRTDVALEGNAKGATLLDIFKERKTAPAVEVVDQLLGKEVIVTVAVTAEDTKVTAVEPAVAQTPATKSISNLQAFMAAQAAKKAAAQGEVK